jgi:hypothetical protein
MKDEKNGRGDTVKRRCGEKANLLSVSPPLLVAASVFHRFAFSLNCNA